MMYVFLMCLFGCLTNCCEAYVKTPEQILAEQTDVAADKVICSFIKKVKKKYDFLVVGTGGGGPGDKGLNLLSVDFESYQKMGIPEARKILVDCVQEFLIEINASEELKQYLAVYPFTAKNIGVLIQFTDKKRPIYMSPPSLAVARIDKEKLAYIINIVETDRLERIKEETYEEALQILEKKDQ